MKLKTKECTHCSGTGKVPEEGSGELLRAERVRLGISIRKLAQALDLSPSYIDDMEKGRRGINTLRALQYLAKVKEMAASKA